MTRFKDAGMVAGGLDFPELGFNQVSVAVRMEQGICTKECNYDYC